MFILNSDVLNTSYYQQVVIFWLSSEKADFKLMQNSTSKFEQKYHNNVHFGGIVVIRGPRILICRATVSLLPDAKQKAQMTLEDGKSKSKGLK